MITHMREPMHLSISSKGKTCDMDEELAATTRVGLSRPGAWVQGGCLAPSCNPS